MKQKTFGRGEVIFREGSYDETMFVICSGIVGIYKAYGTPDQNELAQFGMGQVFGEMGLVDFYPRSATAVSLTDGTVVDEIDSREFIDYLEDEPERVLYILGQLTARIRETRERYDEACRTIYDAIEAEDAGRERDHGIRSRLSSMIASLRRH